MAIATEDPNYKLHITIDYEDEAGYQGRAHRREPADQAVIMSGSGTA